jgi:uncharacterized protein YkvS
MLEKTSCIAEVHKIVDERDGALTPEDEQRIVNLMKIKNTDVSIEKVTFKNHKNYF